MKNKLQIKDLRHKLSWLLCLVAFLAVGQGAWASTTVTAGEVITFDLSTHNWFNNDSFYPRVYIDNTVVGVASGYSTSKVYDITITTTKTGTLYLERTNGSLSYNKNSVTDRSSSSQNNCKITGGDQWGGTWSTVPTVSGTFYYDNTNTKFANCYQYIGRSSYTKRYDMTRVPGTQYLYSVDYTFKDFSMWYVCSEQWWGSTGYSNEDVYKYAYHTTKTMTMKYESAWDSGKAYKASTTLGSITDYSQSKQGYTWEDPASYTVNNYTVTINSGTGGTITVKDYDNNTVSSGASKIHLTVLNITATPSSGYTLKTLTYNGSSISSGSSQTLTANATIEATFESACTTPSAPEITGTTEVCSGSTTTLTSSNANTVWYIGSTQKGTGATYTTDVISANITVDAYAYSGDVSCKSSKVSKNITKKDKPAQPGSILGEAALCANTTYTNRFSITAVSEATSYTWSKSGDGNFTVTGNGTQCTVTTASNYNGGTLQVIATNDCGSSTARTLTLTKVADPAASLLASATVVCTGSDVTITATVNNVDTYNWSTPSGWTLKSSSKTSATYTTAGTGSQTITYTGTNSCDVQQQAQVSVTAAPYPSGTTISSGAASQCIGTTGAQYTASSTAVTGSIYSYSWSVSGTGWSITSSASDNPATFTVGTADGTISVTPTLTTSGKACAGSAVNKTVTVNGVTIGNPSPSAPHEYEPTTFTSSASADSWSVTPSSVEAYLSTKSAGSSTVLKAKAGTYTIKASSGTCEAQKQVTVIAWPDKCTK